jgi:hypothetical protein
VVLVKSFLWSGNEANQSLLKLKMPPLNLTVKHLAAGDFVREKHSEIVSSNIKL